MNNRPTTEQAQIARLQDALDAIARAVGFVPKDQPLSSWVEAVVKERDALKENQSKWVSDAVWQKGIAAGAQKERDEAQAKCAEMRDLLGPKYPGKISFAGRVEWHAWHLSVEDALSSDCGKDFVPRAELDAEQFISRGLREQIRSLSDRLDQAVADREKGAKQALARAKELGL